MNLKRRLDRLSNRLIPVPLPDLEIRTEDMAIMQRIVNDMYSDPERYAKRIKLLEQCNLKYQEQKSTSC